MIPRAIHAEFEPGIFYFSTKPFARGEMGIAKSDTTHAAVPRRSDLSEGVKVLFESISVNVEGHGFNNGLNEFGGFGIGAIVTQLADRLLSAICNLPSATVL